MSLARRVRAGIALHAGVNVAFAIGAVLSAAGGPAAVASDAPLAPLSTAPPSGLPIHSVTTIPVSPLLAGAPTTTTTAPASPATTTAGATAGATARRSVASATASPAAVRTGTTRRVTSTGYCLTGTTASGVRVGAGMAAMNGVPLGTRWRISGGPRDGAVLEVTDRIGHGTEFDIWFPTCDQARQYGRRTITVELLP